MKNDFDEHQDLSQPPEGLHNYSSGFSPRQTEIYQNLKAIGPEIAAYYRDGIRILHNDDLETAASLLGHIAREIDGGLRDVLSEKRKEELEFIISTPDGNELIYESGIAGTFEFTSDIPGTFKVTHDRIEGHKPSILQSLGIDTPSPLAERWLKITKKFYRFVHRRGAWTQPRLRETFIPLWNEYEEVLADLVGNYLNLLTKVMDRLLEFKEPSDKIRKVLPNLLESEIRREYFFNNLSLSISWLKPLKEDGWFNPESNVVVKRSKISTKEFDWFDWWKPLKDAKWFDSEFSSLTRTSVRTSESYSVLRWHALKYVEKIAENTKEHPCQETIDTLVEIIDTIVGCNEDIREKIIEDIVISQQLIRIIFAFPEDSRKNEHDIFIASAYENWNKKHKNVRAFWLGASRLIESIEQNTNPALAELLSNMSSKDRIEFLSQAREAVDKNKHLTEQGLENVYREYVVVILKRIMSYFRVFEEVFSSGQQSILLRILTTLQDRKEIDWEALLRFCHGILSLDYLWTVHESDGVKHKDLILTDIAELIGIGTNDDPNGFDSQLLPLAEQILLVLVEKAESKFAVFDNPMRTFLNSSKGMVFWSIMEYALRFAHENDNQPTRFLLPQAIKTDFTNRLDRNIESSFEFSFMLGFYLPHLLYLDQKWVIDNIDRIFPQKDEHHWYVAFSMYLISSRKISSSFYLILKQGGHYQKALNTNFSYHNVETALAKHICTFWLENYEELDDETSLIYQVLNSRNQHYLSAVISFFSEHSDNLSEENRKKVISAWRFLFKFLSKNKSEEKYSKVLDVLSKWVVFIDKIDEESLEWLKLSVRCVTWDIGILVNTLLKHAHETPSEVGTIYLELSKKGINELLGAFLNQSEVIETIRILYNSGHKMTANQICIQFAEKGSDFLKPLYNSYQQ